MFKLLSTDGSTRIQHIPSHDTLDPSHANYSTIIHGTISFHSGLRLMLIILGFAISPIVSPMAMEQRNNKNRNIKQIINT